MASRTELRAAIFDLVVGNNNADRENAAMSAAEDLLIAAIKELDTLRTIAKAVTRLDVVETMEDWLTCPFACGGADVVLGGFERFTHTVDCPIIVARNILQAGEP